MTDRDPPLVHLLDALQERAKELDCLYRIDEILTEPGRPSDEVCRELIAALPPGWQYPEVSRGRVTLNGETWQPDDFVETPWRLAADILVEGQAVGEIAVFYLEEKPLADEGPFLKEERRLIHAIAERIGLFILQTRLRKAHASWESAKEGASAQGQPWEVLLDFLRQTDQPQLDRLSRKMLNHLCWAGVDEATRLFDDEPSESRALDRIAPDENRPLQKRGTSSMTKLMPKIFDLASRHLPKQEIISCLEVWISEEKSSFLIRALKSPDTSLAEVAVAVERYQTAGLDDSRLPPATQTSLKIALLRRLFADHLEFMKTAKRHVEVRDFYELVHHIIHPARSRGKLGGKSAGLFLATRIIMKSADRAELFSNVKIPKTWYVASDGQAEFIHYNDLDEVYNQKYMEIERVRQDYPNIVHLFKSSRFPPEIVKGLAVALDDFGERPLIVRSSSLLEDQVGSAFSGKYKSLFLANQGTKEERLEALMDAIAEVYASVFGPDPIGYRAERGLLDYQEEMAIMIQEVVGDRVGRFFMPAFSGVAFSNNEFRWSPRLQREDGLLRMVPGLGTRAVDRLSDDYPVLVAPGQPSLRVNATPDEILRYSPKKIDVINLEKNAFETIDVAEMLREYGEQYPLARSILSVVDNDRIRRPVGLEPDWQKDDVVITFDGLLSRTSFVDQMRSLLTLLRNELGMAVDLEFACDGSSFYLLQCRAQSFTAEQSPAAIPGEIPPEQLLFTAARHVANGSVPEITHIVYVDPDRYAEIGDLSVLHDVGDAVGRLNRILPKRQFILMGPGRWGSRGDITLGVNVKYADINNTAMLLEIARKKGKYVPELSFGTHFFQDLVEADIRYLPLYPDEPGIVFNERFLLGAQNMLPQIIPEYAHLADTIRVIDVCEETGGEVLRVLMNADLDEAVGMFDCRTSEKKPTAAPVGETPPSPGDHWRWRLSMAERLAAAVDASRFGIKAMYVLGSTKNASASPGSDIDLLIHDQGNPAQRQDLETWLDGWSLSLAEMNYLRTGYRRNRLLDVHYLSDSDIARETSYAARIGAATDPARPLLMRPPE